MYTDGSCMNQSSGIKCGYGVHFPNEERSDISKKFTRGKLTNQRAELYAVYTGLRSVIKHCVFDKITVYTDSKYSIGCCSQWLEKWKKNGWMNSKKKIVENLDIIKKLDKYMSDNSHKNKIKFKHVFAHSGIKGNEKADELAKAGALST